MTLKEDLGSQILDLSGVELRKSSFSDREAFFAGRKEIAHFHPTNEIDIRLTRKEIRRLRDELKQDKRATLRRSSSADWVEFRFPRRTDLARVLELVELAAAASS